jgi:2,5-dihydroxypyridine 5,6-dioxygenase
MAPERGIEVFDLRSADIQRAFTRQLELCKVEPGEQVVILAEPSSRGDYVAAAFGAAQSLGAQVLSATVPGGSAAPMPSTHTGAGPGLTSVMNSPAAQNLLKAADLVIDLTSEGFIHAPVQQEILATGTRIIFICDAPDVLIRNMPQDNDKARVTAGVDLVAAGSIMRITSDAGTDLTVQLANANPEFQVGFADDKGRWDHWPSTMVLCWPEISNGQIVLAEGDILLPFKEYVRQPATLTVTNGHIDEVTGGGEAGLLNMFFEDSNDKWARYLSHMGWGLMKTGDWFAAAMYGKDDIMGMDARAFAGSFLWSTGPHPVLGRESYAHLDIGMRGCTVSIDGVDVVTDGKLVEI